MLASGFSTTRNIHESWAWVVVIGNGLAGLWALAANWLTPLRTRALWWFIGLAEATVFVQVALGALLVGRYKVPLPDAFYGFVGIIAVAIIYSYRFQMKHRLYMLYGLGSLFVMGLGIRAMLIASGG